MTRKDFYLGISFILIILCVGFHSEDYSLMSFSDFGMFMRESPVLFVLFLMSFLVFICILITYKK